MTDILERLKAALADTYRIERELGEGGMATVYLAHDLKHDRNVAVKVLRPELAAILGGERFLNEIKVTANLQHPNILPLYDSGEADTFLYYVMPYLEGESLRDKMEREKQLGVEETVELAKQVAAALEFAHERGVVHRDIKPENILMQAGQALVADFGIALAVSQAGGTRLTETGLSLGTPHYMSPEQATGDRDIDARSDVYSLGAMIYEMLVGEPPHVGNSVQAIIARILSDTPSAITRTRQLVPMNIDAAVIKALSKSPADRFPTAHAFSEALSNPTFTIPTIATAHASATPVRSRQGANAALVLLVVLVVIAAAWGWLRPGAVPNEGQIAFRLVPGEGSEIVTLTTSPAIAISPDGKTLAWTGPGDPETSIYIRPIGELVARQIPGSDQGGMMFFSPDGQWLAFLQGNRLRKVDVDGGPVNTIATFETAALGNGGAWSSTDTIYIAFEATPGLFKVSAGGSGDVEHILTDDSLLNFYSPSFANDEWLLLGRADLRETFRAELVAYSVTSGVVRVVEGQSFVSKFVPPDRLFFGVDNTIRYTSFDPADGSVSTNITTVLEDVATTPNSLPQFDVSRNGTLVYLGGTERRNSVVFVDRLGSIQDVLDLRREYKDPRFSPDGKQIAFEITDRSVGDIWVYDIETGTQSRFTLTSAAEDLYPVWTPDGSQIVFSSRRSGLAGLWWKPTDGSGMARPILEGSEIRFPGSVTPDGSTLLYREISPNTSFDIFSVSLTGDPTPRPVRVTQFGESSPELSPSGRWLAYVSDESGSNEVYVQSYPDGGARWPVSSGGGTEPVWSPDETELYYRNGERFMSAHLNLGAGSVAVTRRELMFTGNYFSNVRWPEWDVDPTGQTFVLIKEGEQKIEPIVIVNWAQGLD